MESLFTSPLLWILAGIFFVVVLGILLTYKDVIRIIQEKSNPDDQSE